MAWKRTNLGSGDAEHIDKLKTGYRPYGVYSGKGWARVVWAESGSPEGSVYRGSGAVSSAKADANDLNRGEPLISY